MTASQPPKLHHLTPADRLEWLAQQTGLDNAALEPFAPAGGLTLEQADHMIENVAGIYALPFGSAQHFIVNGREVLVPMVIEEPSVVAGASYMAKLARAAGGFTASTETPEKIRTIPHPDISYPPAS